MEPGSATARAAPVTVIAMLASAADHAAAGAASVLTAPPSDPQADMGRLHGLLDHALELAPQRAQVDLLPQPAGEALERAADVVAAPVEAAVDEALDPAPQRQEQPGDDERGGGDGEVRAAGKGREQGLAGEHEARVRPGEHSGERAIGQRPADQPVDVVEPVPKHRHAGGEDDAGEGDRERDVDHASLGDTGRTAR